MGVLRIDPASHGEDRFARHRLIEWWDQDRLSRARALVVGAGALGNEIVKNLALVGIGQILLIDMDEIETSNLTRSVLFREADVGSSKAQVAAQRARELAPELVIRPLAANVVYELGVGAFSWADIVLGGLDNREARVTVNRICRRVRRPFFDGAIERLEGVARCFSGHEGACYECTMSEIDWQLLEARRSCALLGREQLEQGATPTTATTSSIVAGMLCQEALKHLHGLPVRWGTGVVVNGQAGDYYSVTYPRLDDCLAHDPVDEIIELPMGCREARIGELLLRARQDLGAAVVLELSREVLEGFECARCRSFEPVLASLAEVTEADARCQGCGQQRFPKLMHRLEDRGDMAERTLADIGVPAYDMVVARCQERTVGYLLAGDEQRVVPAQRGTDANPDTEEARR